MSNSVDEVEGTHTINVVSLDLLQVLKLFIQLYTLN